MNERETVRPKRKAKFSEVFWRHEAQRKTYMRQAIALSIKSVDEGGGPFGAVVVDLNTGEVIGRGKNRVTLYHDPSAHGEIEAIRDACKNTERNDLVNCALYTSAEPCPGCLTESLFNAGIKRIYYGNSVANASAIGFADDKNWALIGTTAKKMLKQANGSLRQLLRGEAQIAFEDWKLKLDKEEYYKS
ncbi:MAG: nucleoside deaminase [Patescibacteria group bacterium]|nr:nucleoside deaminase [Patescibacteria group bacterium]